jgi:hypothetical protein
MSEYLALSKHLLSLYRESTGHPNGERRDQIISEVAGIAEKVGPIPQGTDRSILERYLRLIGLRLKARSLSAGLPDFLGPITPTGDSGVSVVTCAMNRTANLLRALPSWLAHPEISEVIIVDWGSSEPVYKTLQEKKITDPRVRVVEVSGVARWVLSYAFNIGFRLANFEKILKVDADIVLSSDFFKLNGLPQDNEFIAGNWRNAKEGQGFVNGFFFSPKRALAEVGGFNEFITTYGWDDDDLYERLEARGQKRKDVAPDTVTHLDHTDEERTGLKATEELTARDELLASTRFMIQRNRIMVKKLPAWSKDDKPLPLSYLASQARLTKLEAKQPETTVPRDVYESATEEMLQEITAWDFGPQVRHISKPIFDRMMELPRSALTKTLFEQAASGQEFSKKSERQSSRVPALIGIKKRIFIDPQHGLGNRMRAIGSAAAIARATDRELVIVWEPDHHCDCEFTDLYDYSGPIETERFIDHAKSALIYNYMEIEGGKKNQLIENILSKDTYVRSAFVLNHPSSNWDGENIFIKSLIPADPVAQLVGSVKQPYDLAAHVRMEAGKGLDKNSYDRPEDNWSEAEHKLIQEWRAKSHYLNFIKRIQDLKKEKKVSSLFLAADIEETYSSFGREFGASLRWLRRDSYDRSREQLLYALADAILLSKSPILLASGWSSFSELAMRLAEPGLKVEMSGKDF